MKRMRRFTLLLGIVVAALGLGGAPSAVAANPEVNHYTISDSLTDNDFCGTGQTVDVSVFVRVTEFLAPNQPVDYRNVVEGNVVYTNPLTGATVTDHLANGFSETIISGDPLGYTRSSAPPTGWSTCIARRTAGCYTLTPATSSCARSTTARSS
jgi:hypothetical protein